MGICRRTAAGVLRGLLWALALACVLPAAAAANPATLSQSVSGADHFLSLRSDCEGYTMLGLEGWIDQSAPASIASSAVYRASVPSGPRRCDASSARSRAGGISQATGS